MNFFISTAKYYNSPIVTYGKIEVDERTFYYDLHDSISKAGMNISTMQIQRLINSQWSLAIEYKYFEVVLSGDETIQLIHNFFDSRVISVNVMTTNGMQKYAYTDPHVADLEEFAGTAVEDRHVVVEFDDGTSEKFYNISSIKHS